MHTTTDVGSVTQGQGFRITQCYPSVVRSILRPFADCFGGSLPVQCAPVRVSGGGGAGVRVGGHADARVCVTPITCC